MAFTTRQSLLAKVRDGDAVSWEEFYRVYKPLVILCGKDCYLTPTEIEELVQLVMMEIFKKDIIGKYDPEKLPHNVFFKYDPAKGRFRHYLRKIIRNQALKIYRKRKGKSSESLDDENTHIKELSADVWEQRWEEEWQKHVLAMALTELKGRVQAETYVAFEMYALQDRSVQEVADFLNLSISSVYTAKSRCISIIKEIIKNLENQ